ncbi:MAG: tetratricopeptide repeat protein, partial [Ardenticatenaceae bacterium]
VGAASSMIIPLLVHHYQHAEKRDKERYYAKLAGEQAAAQFAHVEAVRYFRRALELTGQDQAARYDLHSSLEAVYALQGARHAQKEQLTILMALAAKMQDTKRRAEVSIRESDYAEMVCDYPKAIAAAQSAIALAEKIGDNLIEAAGHRLWGRALLRQGEYQSAQQQLLQALRMMSQIESSAEVQRVKGSTLHSLGIVSRQQGDYNAAKRCYQEALTIERTIGDRRGEGATLGNLGMVYQDQGEYVQAQVYYEQDLHITRAIGDRRGEGITLLHLGMVFHAQGDYVHALSYYEQSLPIRQEVGDRRGEGLLLAQLGLLFHHLEENQKAHTYSQQALRIGQEIGSLYVQAYALTFLGHAQVALGDLAQATTTYQQALKLRQEMGLPHLAMESLAGLARIALLKGQLEEAISDVNQILEYLSSPLATLGGTEEPLRIYLTCYRVLQTATGRTRIPPEQVLRGLRINSGSGTGRTRIPPSLREGSGTSRDACATSRGTSRDACATSRGRSCTSRDTARCLDREATVRSPSRPKHIQILRTAYHLLSERAAKISDQGRRQMFLENVKVHRKILQEFS